MKKELDFFLQSTSGTPIIAGIKNDEWLQACKQSSCEIVYVLYGDICSIAEIVDQIKEVGKMAIVHVDLINGFSTKDVCINFIKKYTKADGIISTKPFLIKKANELGLFTVQRFFMIDAITYANIKKHVKENSPDVVEIMPAGLTKMIHYVLEQIDKPLVASGLVLDEEDVMGALKAGAMAVSTTNMKVWQLND
ncbi:MAG: glycerol-3-phosphate responsive antiterminator [Lachnospiraceae bacterium]